MSANVIEQAYRKTFSLIARTLCEQFTKNLTPRVITNRTGDATYLERYYIFGGPNENGDYAADSPLTVILHRFVRSDESNELHNHPWEQSVSFVLAGGYSEERRGKGRWGWACTADGCTWCDTSDLTERTAGESCPHCKAPIREITQCDSVVRRDVPPFSFNFIAADDFHRVDLHEADCWTLFITGRKVASWSFWDRATGVTTPWREFIAKIRGVDVATIADVKRSEFIK